MPVVVSGVPELKKALKKYAPDLLKEMNNEIRLVLKEVTAEAKAKVPGQVPGNLYNWADTGKEPVSKVAGRRAFPKYNGQVVKRGLTYSMGRGRRNRSGFASLYSLLNKSAAGAIAETAGRESGLQGKNPSGSHFISRINSMGTMKSHDNRQLSRGRILFAAYAENEGKALDGTFRAIEKASKTFDAMATVRKAG